MSFRPIALQLVEARVNKGKAGQTTALQNNLNTKKRKNGITITSKSCRRSSSEGTNEAMLPRIRKRNRIDQNTSTAKSATTQNQQPAVCEHVVVNEETSGHIAVEQRLMRQNEFVFRRWVEGGAQKRFIVVPPELDRRAESAAKMRWN